MDKDRDDELSMDKIEDYNNNESDEKRKIIRIVIISGLIVGALLTYFRSDYSGNDQYIGSEDNPGITTKK